jgi:signal transduction histidine kinase
LNFVKNFSEVSQELLDEMKEELANGNYDEAQDIAKSVIENLDKIAHHGNRADGIVKGMLQHSRSGKDVKEETDINVLADEYLRLAYHGLRAKDKSFNANFETDFDLELPMIEVMPQDIGRVLLNLINNAFYACTERSRSASPEHGQSNPSENQYQPMVTVKTTREKNNIRIEVRDNGSGVPAHVIDKIFQPFFTTKPTGEGTGLGLSMSYDIVTKGHGGELKVDTTNGKGTTFVVVLPVGT